MLARHNSTHHFSAFDGSGFAGRKSKTFLRDRSCHFHSATSTAQQIRTRIVTPVDSAGTSLSAHRERVGVGANFQTSR
jgi:hypothetical protein